MNVLIAHPYSIERIKGVLEHNFDRDRMVGCSHLQAMYDLARNVNLLDTRRTDASYMDLIVGEDLIHSRERIEPTRLPVMADGGSVDFVCDRKTFTLADFLSAATYDGKPRIWVVYVGEHDHDRYQHLRDEFQRKPRLRPFQDQVKGAFTETDESLARLAEEIRKSVEAALMSRVEDLVGATQPRGSRRRK